jgi:hypothetical protein
MIVIPSTILFVAVDTIPNPFRISIGVCNSCPEFDRWQRLRACGIPVDLRRILKIDSGFGDLSDYLINDSVFEEESIFGMIDRISNENYHRCEDGSSRLSKQFLE